MESQRGSDGGYYLIRNPRTMTVGELLRFMHGPIYPVSCLTDDPKDRCILYGECVFLPMWERVGRAISDVYDSTTFHALVEEANRMAAGAVLTYAI